MPTPTPDDNVLLMLHGMSPVNVASYIAPLVEQLQARWPGRVLLAWPGQVEVWLDDRPRVLVHGEEVLPAVVYTAAGCKSGGYSGALAAALQSFGATLVNTPEAAALAASKFQSAIAFAQAGLPIPPQTLLGSRPFEQRLESLEELSWPMVIKRDRGSGGAEVSLAGDRQGVADLLDDSYTGPLQQDAYIAQQFRADASASDVRILVIDGRIAGAVMRKANKPGEFRSNLQLGGSAHPVTITDGEADIAVRAAAALGLRIAGVDLLRTVDGPMLTEVNSNPSVNGIADCYGPGVYAEIADAVVRTRQS